MTDTADRSYAIMKAHVEVLGDRDPRSLSAGDLFAEIAKAVPGVTHEEIITALQKSADQAIEEAQRLIQTLKPGDPSDPRNPRNMLRWVIHTPDRTATAIAYEQGKVAGLAGNGTQEDVPAIYRKERSYEGCAWFHGHIQGAAIRKICDQTTDAYLRREIKAGRLVYLGNDRLVSGEDYRPETHGPALPYRRSKPLPRPF